MPNFCKNIYAFIRFYFSYFLAKLNEIKFLKIALIFPYNVSQQYVA